MRRVWSSGIYIIYFSRNALTFWTNVVFHPQSWRVGQSRDQPTCYWFLSCLTLWHWRWRLYSLLKCHLTSARSMMSNAEYQTLHSHCYENMKSNKMWYLKLQACAISCSKITVTGGSTHTSHLTFPISQSHVIWWYQKKHSSRTNR
jgi:hypothetical protein